MNITRERFSQGLTYDEYKAGMSANREALEKQEGSVEIYASDLIALKSLPERLNVLAIVDGESADVVTYLPVLGRLASDSGMLNVRVVPLAENPDLVDELEIGHEALSLPAFVFYDAAFEEIGRFVGQPANVAERLARRKGELYARYPELGSPDAQADRLPEDARAQLSREMAAIREQTRELATAEAIGELVAIVRRHQARLRSVRKLGPPQAVRPKHPVKVTITYCAACGYEPQTIELVQALMLRARFDLSSIEIVVGEEGAFEVSVGGELVHSMYRDGGFPERETILKAVKAHLTDGDQAG
jgi:selenoprotein W-related protein